VLLGQVMSKGDRMDYAIQKATELGVSTIQLLTSERCEMRLKYERDKRKLNIGNLLQSQRVNNAV
jgi:16S rRNA (uracil1498-N3)-methyltransferase